MSTSRKRVRTWTATFMCLSSNQQNKVPNSAEKECLFKAGLGLKKITFENNAKEKVVHDTIKREYPKLEECGGFELLRCTNSCRILQKLDCKWDVSTLKSIVGPQGKFYVRPIQKCLPVEVTEAEEERSDLRATCETCGNDFPLSNIRSHIDVCNQSYNTSASYTESAFPPLPTENSALSSIQFEFHTASSHPTLEISGDWNTELPDLIQSPSTNSSAAAVPGNENTELPVFLQSSSAYSTSTVAHEDQNTELQDSFENNTTEIIIQNEGNARNLTGENNTVYMTQQLKDKQDNECMKTIVQKCATFCRSNDITDPVHVLRIFQKEVVTGRPLEITEETSATSIYGETNFILVDRNDILKTAIDEIMTITDLRKCLEVQFYGECAVDLGGPRKEFFSIVLKQVQDNYFQPVKEWSDDYQAIGRIMALSTLQNGRLPRIMSAELVEKVFKGIAPADKYIQDLRKGLDSLGLIQLVQELPTVLHLFTPNNSTPLTLKMLTHLLQPNFSAEGSNRRLRENSMYALFVKYMREAASGRRGVVTLNSILRFTTGTEEEPALGFSIKPEIEFIERDNYIPTANTCVNKLNLTVTEVQSTAPTQEELFKFFDFAFSNTFFGLE